MSKFIFVMLLPVMLFAYQWPAKQSPSSSFLQQSDNGVNLGLNFSNPQQGYAYADGELIYSQEAAKEHPRSLPSPNKSLAVLQHNEWLISYLATNMQPNDGHSTPALLQAGDVIFRRGEGDDASSLQVEFFDSNNNRIVSPWLLLSDSSEFTLDNRVAVDLTSEDFRTRMRPKSYLEPRTYNPILISSRTPVTVRMLYDSQQLIRLDLSTVESRKGQFYTNDGLTPLADIFQQGALALGALTVQKPLRSWHQLQIKANFDDLKETELNYDVYVLPPQS